MPAENLLPEAPLITGVDYLFPQECTSCHASCASHSWFKTNSVKLLDWPLRSLDLNHIENKWGISSGEEYKNGTHNANKDKLTSSIELAWKNSSKQTLTGLPESKTERLISIIEKKVLL